MTCETLGLTVCPQQHQRIRPLHPRRPPRRLRRAQLEGAQGGPDVEARQKLELLKAQLALMESAEVGAEEAAPPAALLSEVAVAQELDRYGALLPSAKHVLLRLARHPSFCTLSCVPPGGAPVWPLLMGPCLRLCAAQDLVPAIARPSCPGEA